MIITGSALLVRPGAAEAVIARLAEFPEVTYHACSENGTELVVNFEAQGGDDLTWLCENLKKMVPDIIDISHLYMNFEDEIEKIGN
jgi:nitrate reductase NapAB chaperone NapD